MDSSIGVYVIDRFTYHTLEFLEKVNQNSNKTIKELVRSFLELAYESLDGQGFQRSLEVKA